MTIGAACWCPYACCPAEAGELKSRSTAADLAMPVVRHSDSRPLTEPLTRARALTDWHVRTLTSARGGFENEALGLHQQLQGWLPGMLLPIESISGLQ